MLNNKILVIIIVLLSAFSHAKSDDNQSVKPGKRAEKKKELSLLSKAMITATAAGIIVMVNYGGAPRVPPNINPDEAGRAARAIEQFGGVVAAAQAVYAANMAIAQQMIAYNAFLAQLLANYQAPNPKIRRRR